MDPYRLPRAVVPSRYDLRLEPDLNAATFAGRVDIAVDVREPVTEIVLNAAELHVAEAAAEGEWGNRLTAAVTLDEATERCRLRFESALMKGKWRLRLSFTGTLNDKLRGFYRSKYKNQEGDWRYLAATQFEATDARRAFPCWDEPAFKAVFASTLVVDPALQVVSNTAVAEQRVEGGKKVVRFTDTIPMSTYLVAFVVGELEATEPVMVGKAPLRAWCVPGKKHLTAFGRDIGAFSLGLFEDYYGRKYPGDKLDLIAIPDFAAGAMENLGAITFRETALLVDDATATHAERERVADVVAHENAHMWFGDLVTMGWWNGLWLNEAFATFMEMLAVDAWKPEWKRWTTFGASRQSALAVDGLRSTRPIEFPVEAPKDADAMFDVLTYEKGASVLRMLEQYIGAEVFRDGVRRYLDRHAFGNTETADLWRALGEASELPIPEVMDGWIFHPGYPLIDVAKTAEGRVVLRQRRFLYLGDEPSPGSHEAHGSRPVGLAPPLPGERGGAVEEPVWRTPVQLRFRGAGAERQERTLLSGGEAVTYDMAGAEAVLVNAGGHGFYRVRYAPELLGPLLRAPDRLEAIERYNLVNDAWASVLAGLTPLTEFLELTKHFRGERDRNVWGVIVGALTTLNRIVEDADRPRLAALVRDRLAPAASELGWAPQPGESELTGQLRGDLIRALGVLGDDRVVQARAAGLYAAPTPDANVFAAVVPVLAHVGDAPRYEEFGRRFRAARTPQEEQRYLLALTGFRPPELVEKTLARTLGGDVRTQDAMYVLNALLLSVHGRERAWAFLQENWDRLSGLLPPNGLRRVCEAVAGLARPEWERQVRAFFESKKVNLGGKRLEQCLEQLRIVVRLREREGEALRAHLAG